ncbi:hypothetical protein U1Q18_048063, partial [Sarracenia purpurea var. burkii]
TPINAATVLSQYNQLLQYCHHPLPLSLGVHPSFSVPPPQVYTIMYPTINPNPTSPMHHSPLNLSTPYNSRHERRPQR